MVRISKIKATALLAAVMMAVLTLLSGGTTAYADYAEDISQQLEAASDTLSDEAKEALENSGGYEKITIGYILGYVWDAITDRLSVPFRLLGKLLGIVLICSMFSALSDEGELGGTLSAVGALSAVGVLYVQISEAMDIVCEMLSELNTFMLAYIPVFAGLLTGSGYSGTASGYYVMLMFLCEVISLFAQKLIVPLCSVILAVSVVEGLSPNVGGGLSSGLKKGIQWALGLSATAFVGVLSVKSIVASAADSVAVRAAKFTASSFVPVIGSAVSEAYTTVSGSVALIRSSAGSMGVLAVVFIAVRPVAAVAMMGLAVKLCSFFAGVLGVKSISRLLSGASDVFSILMTIAILMGLLFVIATALMMLSCMNL